ncbi:MAG: inorganic phosphate transporter [Bacteroidales bacterium]|jgi:PiT family inorganic phosphate transporter|nr:inorganic phosphate transporter [Bacteroidales bacterium]
MIFLFLTSGLFLGWTLGANDAANVFGSAVGSRMISFTRAAVIASVFVIMGAVIQGSGASDTLGRLGSVNAMGGAFTVALAAGLTVYFMTRAGLPVSTTQAIVGAIIGWNFFTNNAVDTGALIQIVTTWITGPVLGALFAFTLYHLVKITRKKIKVHLLEYESYLRAGLMIAGAFGAYSLGANNIANVMGVFVPSIPLDDADFGLFTLSGAQQLFFLGSIAISAGVLTYSKKVMQTVGNNLIELSSEAAFVVVLSQALVLFIFSSASLSGFMVRLGLPPIPLVPVSSTQVVVGAVLGIGLYKGVRNINLKVLGSIASGWITTPVAAGLLAFILLFFVKNLFGIDVGHSVNLSPQISKGFDFSPLVKYIIIVLLIITSAYLIYIIRKEKKSTDLINKKYYD